MESKERSRPRHRPALPALARTPVGLVAGGLAALLLATSNGYGYHRDELYFRVLGQHPAWGYVDQPPLTPLLGRLATAVFGDHLWALRLPATPCTVTTGPERTSRALSSHRAVAHMSFHAGSNLWLA
ncbi:MAG TPA: hypothetical protein VK659_25290 [Asanoa sp.]|nr:hypothetical protein [Asanoa sp.]